MQYLNMLTYMHALEDISQLIQRRRVKAGEYIFSKLLSVNLRLITHKMPKSNNK